MIPSFKKSGLLPTGIHFATWVEFEKRFASNRHRQILMAGLRKGLKILQHYGCTEVYIGGSFVTSNLEPGDIDVCYENTYIDWNRFLKENPEFKPTKYGAKLQMKKYGCEFYPVNAFEDNMVQFFQFDKEGNAKGIVKIVLTNSL
jgi:hypothetical protein